MTFGQTPGMLSHLLMSSAYRQMTKPKRSFTWRIDWPVQTEAHGLYSCGDTRNLLRWLIQQLYEATMHEVFDVQLSLSTQTVLRTVYGALLIGTLMNALPRRRYFLSERWNGFSESDKLVDVVQSPIGAAIVSTIWIVCALGLTFGVHTVVCAILNVLFSYYFFISQRWRSVARGMGAPGFMTYWLGVAVLLTEFSLRFAPELRGLVLTVLQIDFALIMLSAGLYKMSAGYAHNQGMEFGMANPQWSYWPNFFSKIKPSHWFFHLLNHSAWLTEVVAAVLMLFPQTRFWGGVLIMLSFVFILTQIRLNLLSQMVIACCLLFFQPGSLGDRWLVAMLPVSYQIDPIAHFSWGITVLNAVLSVWLWSYLCLTPLVHAGLFYNLFARRRLPEVLQKALESYANFFGIIIWRVFSADLTNFFVLVFERPRVGGGDRKLLSRYGWKGSARFNYVCEAITLTSLFTTRKYHPSDLELFRKRLLRYCKTLSCPNDSLLEFDYVSVVKSLASFEYKLVSRFIVDPVACEVEEETLDSSISLSAAHQHSPVFEGSRPGSYAPSVR